MPDRVKQLLPFESVAVMNSGMKITGNIAETIRFAKGMEEARTFLVKEKGWLEKQFEEVDWNSLHCTLKCKPDGYVTWLCKQHTGFCGTRVMVGRYSGEEEVDETCPNCGCRENAAHLCVCTNEERSRLFEENVEELRGWMQSHGNTDPQLVHWVSKYILE